MAVPNYNAMLREMWGWDDERPSFNPFSCASNVVIGENPPYSINDFVAIYPQFAPTTGAASVSTPLEPDGKTPANVGDGVLTLDSVSPVLAGAQVGDYSVVCIAASAGGGTFRCFDPAGNIVAADFQVGDAFDTQIQFSIAAGLTVDFAVGDAFTVNVISSGGSIPPAVLNAFIALASASVVQKRWQDSWQFAMALYVAHYVTLWIETAGLVQGGNAAQIAGAGLASGIEISKSVGPLSVSYALLPGLENYGAWNLTKYGQLFATMCKGIGAGGMLLI